MAQFDDERSTVSDALTYCDMAIGPAGQQVNLDERLDEIATRYKPGGLVVTALAQARPHLEQAVARFQRVLDDE